MGHDCAVVRDDRLARSAVDALDAAWESGDVEAILDCFDPDLVFFGSGDGEEAVGRDGLRTLLGLLAPRIEGGRFTIEWDSLRADRLGDVAVISGIGRIRSSGTLSRFDRTPYRLTGVIVERDGRWRWKVYHGSEPGSWD
jgi:uncharacterized protein (TIGR02246 family)